MTKGIFRTTTDEAGARRAIAAALHSAIDGTAPRPGMMTAPPGQHWFIWPELREREGGDRGGFYFWLGHIYGELLEPLDPDDDDTAEAVHYGGAIIGIELRDYSGMAPTTVRIYQARDETAGLFAHLADELGRRLPVEMTIDQATPPAGLLVDAAAVDVDQTQAGDKAKRSKGGAPRRTAHVNAIARLSDGQTKQANYAQWSQEYAKETGKDPDETDSGGAELYRKRVWEVWQRSQTDRTKPG